MNKAFVFPYFVCLSIPICYKNVNLNFYFLIKLNNSLFGAIIFIIDKFSIFIEFFEILNFSLFAEKYIEGGAGTGISLDNQITSSVGFAADISASSEGGFEYDGLISGSSTSTASFAYVKVNDFTVNLADNPQFTTMSQKETFVVPNHTSKSYASDRTAPTASDLISTSSYTDVISGNIWINNSDGSLNFDYISGSQTSQSGYLFSKKIVGYETH